MSADKPTPAERAETVALIYSDGSPRDSALVRQQIAEAIRQAVARAVAKQAAELEARVRGNTIAARLTPRQAKLVLIEMERVAEHSEDGQYRREARFICERLRRAGATRGSKPQK